MSLEMKVSNERLSIKELKEQVGIRNAYDLISAMENGNFPFIWYLKPHFWGVSNINAGKGKGYYSKLNTTQFLSNLLAKESSREKLAKVEDLIYEKGNLRSLCDALLYRSITLKDADKKGFKIKKIDYEKMSVDERLDFLYGRYLRSCYGDKEKGSIKDKNKELKRIEKLIRSFGVEPYAHDFPSRVFLTLYQMKDLETGKWIEVNGATYINSFNEDLRELIDNGYTTTEAYKEIFTRYRVLQRAYHVYSVADISEKDLTESQIEYLERKYEDGRELISQRLKAIDKANKDEDIPLIDLVRVANGLDLTFKSDDAPSYYDIKTETIVLNKPEDYIDLGFYKATYLHELMHGVAFKHIKGHKETWMSKSSSDKVGLAIEEMQTELSAYFMAYKLNITDFSREQTMAYLNNWAKALKEVPEHLESVVDGADMRVNVANKNYEKYLDNIMKAKNKTTKEKEIVNESSM